MRANLEGGCAEAPTGGDRTVARLFCGTAAYCLLLVGFWLGVRHLGLLAGLGDKLPWAFASFGLLLAPLWFFGFGAADWIRDEIRSSWIRVVLPAALAVPYLLFSVATGQFRWEFAVAMLGLPVLLAALLECSASETKLTWQDLAVLALIAAVQMMKLLIGAWPHPGLASLPKLYLIDVALYLYLVVRRLDGMGYSLVPTRASFAIGVRELCFFLPFGLGLGAALRFIRLHPHLPSGLTVGASLVLTFLLVVVPEEIFFRAILQNLLETRFGRQGALLLASLLFGLAHFNKGAAFNWRYVVLAAIAGVFYGRAWRAQRQVLASAVTHTAVDVIWSLWFR